MDRIDFAPPSVGVAECEAAADAVASGWLTTGPRAALLGARIKELARCHEAVPVASATLGMQAVLLGLKRHYGAKKIVFPAITFSSMPMQAHMLGYEVTFADVDDRCHLDIPQAVAADPDVTCVTHMAGAVADVLGLRGTVIEDCAHLYPGFESAGYIAGNCALSDFSIFSFYPTKAVAAAEGGAVTTATAFEWLRRTTLHGFDRDAINRYRATGGWQYDIVEPGTKANMSDVSAAIALVQLGRRVELLRRRRQVSQWYRQRLVDRNDIQVLHQKDRHQGRHAEHLMVVLLPDGVDRDYVCDRMHEQGIATSLHFRPLHQFKFWQEEIGHGRVKVAGPLTKAEVYGRRALSLPMHAMMTEEQVARVCSTLLGMV